MYQAILSAHWRSHLSKLHQSSVGTTPCALNRGAPVAYHLHSPLRKFREGGSAEARLLLDLCIKAPSAPPRVQRTEEVPVAYHLHGSGDRVSTEAAQQRHSLSELDEGGQPCAVKCDIHRTKASKFRRHDPLFQEQRRPPLLIICMVCPPNTWFFRFDPQPKLSFSELPTERRTECNRPVRKACVEQGGRHGLQAN